jgi:[ribosomal protein S18]-alanine N-acetyltransferase
VTDLRRMRWWDIEALLPLERELFPDDAWSAETFWSELAHPDSRHYVVAEAGGPAPPGELADRPPPAAMRHAHPAGRLVGYAGLLVSAGSAEVQTLAVAPGWQGRGLGARLLTALLAEAARRDCAEVLLEVRADNAPAQALYRRFGFQQLSLRRGYYQPGGVDALVMRRRGLRTVGQPPSSCSFMPTCEAAKPSEE